MKIVWATIISGVLFAAGFGQSTKLTGTVYDATGAVIVGAEVTAVDRNKVQFKTRTNESGEYELTLPFNRYEPTRSPFRIVAYEVTAMAPYFQKTVISDFKVVPAYSGKLRLDFALDVIGVDPCHDPTDCHTIPIDKIKDGTIPERISSRPKKTR